MMIPIYEPLSPKPALICWNLNTSQTKEKNDTLIGARYIPQCGDLIDAKKHTLNDLISASNIPLYTLT